MPAKRCPFCKKKLDDKGLCQNKECIDYKRTKIIEEQEKENPKQDNNN